MSDNNNIYEPKTTIYSEMTTATTTTSTLKDAITTAITSFTSSSSAMPSPSLINRTLEASQSGVKAVRLLPAIKLSVQVFSSVELLLHFATIPLVFFCAYLFVRSAVLHRNLKFVLIGLCLQILLFSLTRLHTLVNFFSERGAMTKFSYFVSFTVIVYGNLVGHALIIERLLATIWVEKYEHYTNWLFTATWIVVTLSLSIANGYYQAYVFISAFVVSAVALYTHIVAMAASFAEIFIMAMVTILNEKRFKLAGFTPKVHPLNVRYQLTENIRTGRQLGPTFLCHFITVSLSFSVIMNNIFKWFSEVNANFVFIAIVFLIHTATNLAQLSTLIIFHPMLNRRARKVLREWRALVLLPAEHICSCCLSHQQNNNNNNNNNNNSSRVNTMEICPLPMDVTGRYLLTLTATTRMKGSNIVDNNKQESDAHFRQLHQAWGDKNLY